MPPQRTGSLQRTASTKPLRSERTHEENQERAYIAASRRSDRSLEARVESARRASEIHKRRTGRGLRVTEADVLNEEMYEEEDDEFSHGYRNLGIMMSGANIDRRFAAYYQHQIHMRNVISQAIQDQRGNGVQALDPSQTSGYMGGYGSEYPFYMQPSAGSYAQLAQHRQQPYNVPHIAQNHGRSMSMHIPPNSGMAGTITGTGSGRPILPTSSSVVDGQMHSSAHLHKRHMSVPTVSTTPNNLAQQLAPSLIGYTSPTGSSSPRPHLSSPPTEHSEIDPLYPFTAELPAESARFFAGQMPQASSGYLSDAGMPELLSGKMFSKYIQPHNPFSPDDFTAPITEDIFWQQKPETCVTSAPSQISTISESPRQEDLLDTIFNDTSLLPTNSDALLSGLKVEDGSSITDGFSGENVESDTWESFMNQEWLEQGVL